MVLDQGYRHIDAARSLGLVRSALRRWVNQSQEVRNDVTPAGRALTPSSKKSKSWKPGSIDWNVENRSKNHPAPYGRGARAFALIDQIRALVSIHLHKLSNLSFACR
ncbi:transposase [Pseudomonas sp. 1121_17]